jgi:hypothetical protein
MDHGTVITIDWGTVQALALLFGYGSVPIFMNKIFAVRTRERAARAVVDITAVLNGRMYVIAFAMTMGADPRNYEDELCTITSLLNQLRNEIPGMYTELGLWHAWACFSRIDAIIELAYEELDLEVV